MMAKKELNLEDLEEVNGGTSGRYETYKVEYKDKETGETGYHVLEDYYSQTIGRVKAEIDGQKWCTKNYKTYVRIHLIGSQYRK